MIYFIRNPRSGNIKIGHGKPLQRLAAGQTWHDAQLELLAIADGGRTEERLLHHRFAADRVDGEWFLPSEELMKKIRAFTKNDRHYGCLYLFDPPQHPDGKGYKAFATIVVAGMSPAELADDLLRELKVSLDESGSGATIVVARRQDINSIIKQSDDEEDETEPKEVVRISLSRQADPDRAKEIANLIWKTMCW